MVVSIHNKISLPPWNWIIRRSKMTSLVADYGTSSGSESEQDTHSDDADNTSKGEDEEDEEDYQENEKKARSEATMYNNRESDQQSSEMAKTPLPTPNFGAAPTMKTSVFTNPFVEAEKAKSAILEKHVKMTPTLDDTKMINGRKICWNYRKGRCRFGHNCTFAHDSDLHRSAAELEASRSPEETLICQTHYNGKTAMNNDEEQEIDQENNQLQKRKKRPGLAQNLVPGKKVLKLYKAQQAKAVGR